MKPILLTREQFTKALRMLADKVEHGDSSEGSIQFDLVDDHYEVLAYWRTGFILGHDGTVSIGDPGTDHSENDT